MPQTFPLTGAVELAVVERSGFVESRHAGVAITLAPDGTVVDKFGDVSALFLPRSSLKPLQALACLTAGATLEGEQLGLATASHSGTDRHVDVVRDMLSAVGLGEDDLGCPPAWPIDPATRNSLVRDLGQPASVRMSCSGKHAAMLAASVSNGWDPASYLDLNHPVQMHIREVIERLTGEKIAASAVDGCGAPIYALTVFGFARALHRIGTASTTSPFALHRSAGALVQAVRAHPWTIDGPGRPDTVAIEQLGVFAKSGAEGVMAMVAPDGTTTVVKVLDGSGRAGTAVALRLLERAGSLSAQDVADTMSKLPLAVHGGGTTVGAIRPSV